MQAQLVDRVAAEDRGRGGIGTIQPFEGHCASSLVESLLLNGRHRLQLLNHQLPYQRHYRLWSCRPVKPLGLYPGSPTRQATGRTVVSKSDIGDWRTPSESNARVSGITHAIEPLMCQLSSEPERSFATPYSLSPNPLVPDPSPAVTSPPGKYRLRRHNRLVKASINPTTTTTKPGHGSATLRRGPRRPRKASKEA